MPSGACDGASARRVAQARRIENDEIGGGAPAHTAAIAPADPLGGRARHLAHCLLEREEPRAHVGREHARKGPEAGRVLVALVGQDGVRLDRAEWMREHRAQRILVARIAAVGVVARARCAGSPP